MWNNNTTHPYIARSPVFPYRVICTFESLPPIEFDVAVERADVIACKGKSLPSASTMVELVELALEGKDVPGPWADLVEYVADAVDSKGYVLALTTLQTVVMQPNVVNSGLVGLVKNRGW